MLETDAHVEIRGKRDPFSETSTNCLNGLSQYMSEVHLWRLGFKFLICYRYIMKAKSETYNYKGIETMIWLP